MERFANDVASTLNGAITNVATSLVVTSATGFPDSGDFRIRIDDELLLVTAVAGTTFTVTRGVEGTTGAAHSDLAPLTHVLTAASVVAPVNEHSADTTGIHGITDSGLLVVKDLTNLLTLHNAIGNTALIDQDLLAADGVTETDALTVLNVNEDFTDTTASITRFGFRSDVQANPPSAVTNAYLYGADLVARIKAGNIRNWLLVAGADFAGAHHGTGVVTQLYGGKAIAVNSGGGTISTALGLQVLLSNTDGTMTTAYGLYVSLSNADVIGTFYGVRVDKPTGAGTITNAYGLYLADFAGVGGTLSYGLYLAGATAKHYVQGELEVAGKLVIPRIEDPTDTTEGTLSWDPVEDEFSIGNGSGRTIIGGAPAMVARLFTAGRYYAAGAYGDSGAAVATGELLLVPFPVGETQTFSDIKCKVDTISGAGGVLRMGVFTTDAGGLPSTIVANSESGTISTETTGVKTHTFSSAISLTAGLYWLAVVAQVSGCSLRSGGVGQGLQEYISFGAFPDARGVAYVDTGVTGTLPSPPVIAADITQAPVLVLVAS